MTEEQRGEDVDRLDYSWQLEELYGWVGNWGDGGEMVSVIYLHSSGWRSYDIHDIRNEVDAGVVEYSETGMQGGKADSNQCVQDVGRNHLYPPHVITGSTPVECYQIARVLCGNTAARCRTGRTRNKSRPDYILVQTYIHS